MSLSSEAFRALPALATDSHKGDAGRVVALVGSETMPGAAILVARAAQRAGAGLVRVGCLDAGPMTVVPAAAPEAVLLDLRQRFADAAHFEADRAHLAAELRGQHACLAGPGLGATARTRSVVMALLSEDVTLPLVLDADALNVLDGEPELLRDRAGQLVLTPHPGEAERLLGRPIPREESGRIRAASELAERSGAVVCLKGAGTVVAQGGRLRVNTTGNPGLATAGSGDVLAGVLLAYLGRLAAAGSEVDAFSAAALAVHVHGLAGDLAAERLGQRAVVASDLVDELPQAQQRAETELR